MRERGIFLCIATLASAALGFIEGGLRAADSARRLVDWPGDLAAVLILATIVCICAALLARVMDAPRPVAGVLSALACAVAIVCSPDTSLPMIAATAVSVSCEYLRTPWVVFTASAACAAGLPLTGADAASLAESVFIVAASVYALSLMAGRDEARRESFEKSDRIEDLIERVSSQNRLAKSMDHIAKLEERNRLATRIHDEIGHGISGGILLLEGADMIVDKDPEKARETVRRVTENLRESADKIRAVLRGERSDAAEVNLARIRAELASFEADHPRVRAVLTTEGDMARVGGVVWTCVLDNMTEAMTNTLKHSDATVFDVSVTNSNKLLIVKFSDNGAGRNAAERLPETRAGMGLRNMEERCSLAYGRCFFRHGKDGFHVVMTFPQRNTTPSPDA
jgi:signal transduction histidine kinase